MVFWGLLNFRRDEELATVGVELLNIDLEFSDTWWLLRHRGLRWSHHDYTRQLAICMDQYRDVDEAAIGSYLASSARQRLKCSRHSMWPT